MVGMGMCTGLIMVMTTKERLVAALVLVLMASILPEMLSGNTPILLLFSPQVFLFILFGYGLPILLIREFVVRHSISMGGLFLIGLGYGIINEALLAKTVFRNDGVPLADFAEYGFAFSVQWAWTVYILPWHAVASTILPIALAHRAFPAAANKPWLGIKTSVSLALLLFVLINVFYFNEDATRLPRTAPMMLALWIVIALLVAVAWSLKGRQHFAATMPSNWKLVALGYSGIIPFLSLLFMAHFMWPFAVYVAIAMLWIALYRWTTFRFLHIDHPAFGWFGLGWYLHIGTFSWLVVAQQYPYKIVVDLLAFGLLIWILQRRRDTKR
jgi:hypothetical protein